jgi:hypothetical protein
MAERFVTQGVERDPRLVVETIVTIVARCVFGPSFTPELTQEDRTAVRSPRDLPA